MCKLQQEQEWLSASRSQLWPSSSAINCTESDEPFAWPIPTPESVLVPANEGACFNLAKCVRYDKRSVQGSLFQIHDPTRKKNLPLPKKMKVPRRALDTKGLYVSTFHSP